MTESAFTSKLLKALRSHVMLRDAVIWKLNDRTTSGIPDVLISLRGVTTFFELKVWPNSPTKIQTYFLQKLMPRAYLVTLTRDKGILLVGASKFMEVFDFNEAVREIAVRCQDWQIENKASHARVSPATSNSVRL